MTDPIKDFIGEAMGIRMSKSEHEEAKLQLLQNIAAHDVRNVSQSRQQSGMQDPIASFTSTAKNIELTPSERSSIRSAILSAAARMDNGRAEAPEGAFSWLSIFKGMPAMAAFLLLIGAGGVSYAAEGAVPGDALYPVKIHVNEKVMAQFALSPEQQARLQAKQATRRLQEAECLASQARLDAETEVHLQTAFQGHARSVRRQIALLAASQETAVAGDIGNEFQASLEAHESVLQRLSEANTDAGSSIDVLIKDVQIAQAETERSRVTVEIAMSTVPTEERQMSAENTLVSAGSRLEKVRLAIRDRNDDQHAEAFRKLEIAQTSLDEAAAKMDSGNYSDGFSLVRRSLKNAEEAHLIAEFQAKIGAGTTATDATLTFSSSNASTPDGQALDATSADKAMQKAQPEIKKATEKIDGARKRLKAARELLGKRRGSLSAEAIAEAGLKLDGAGKTLDQAADFSAKGLTVEADSYGNAAISALDYVESFVGETPLPGTTLGNPSSSQSSSSAQSSSDSSSSQASASSEASSRPILSPRYLAVRQAIEDFQAVLGRSQGLLSQASVQQASSFVISAQNTLVAGQAAFDAGNDAEADALFDKALAQAKEGTGILAAAAQKAILDTTSSSSASTSSSSSAPAASSSSSQGGVLTLPPAPGL